MTDLKREQIRHDWIEALRSGEYRQGKNYLNYGGAYCCLGVLCEVVIAHGIPITKEGEGLEVQYSKCSYVPPSLVMEAVGVTDWGADGPTHLTNLNDHGKTFATIADYLESGAFWVENQRSET